MTAPFNPYAHLKAAASGDIAAQRLLAESAAKMAFEGGEQDPVTTLVEGLIFARLAAAQGNDGDKGRVISMLALAAEAAESQGDGGTAGIFGAEAIACMSLLGEQGHGIANDAIDAIAENADAETMAMAQQFERLMREVI